MSDFAYDFGGIWCVVPIGELYDRNIAQSVRGRLRAVFGPPAHSTLVRYMNENQLDDYIRTNLPKIVSESMSGTGGLRYRLSFLLRTANRKEWQMEFAHGKELESINRRLSDERNGVTDALRGRTYPKANLTDAERKLKARSEKLTERVIQLTSYIKEIEQSFGFAIFLNGKVQGSTISLTGPSGKTGNRGRFAHIRAWINQNSNKLPLFNKGWSILIVVAHPLAARFESKTAYPDKRYMGYKRVILYDMAHTAATDILAKLGHTSRKPRYGYILSRRGYEGKRLILE